MRTRSGALLVTIALGASLPLLLSVSAAPAAALSCAAHPDGSPQAIASGTEVLATGERFFDAYDFAVIGTVTAIRTDEREGSPTYGATEIDLDVTAVLAVDDAPTTMTLTAGDPGWMVGWPFQVGTAYFVPVDAVGPEGQVNWTFGCDPVSELADPEATATELVPLAAAAGFDLTRPRPAEGEGGGAGPAPGDDDGMRWFVPAISVAAVGCAAATALVQLRRRPGHAPAG